MIAAVLKWIVIILAFINVGYMAYDGTRAIVTGDYVRPKTGEYAGQLGPWTKLVTKIGIDPMSTFMKSVFIVYGIVGLFLTVCFMLGVSWAWKALLIYNICSLWNLFYGTASGILQIVLLVIIRLAR